MTRYTNCSIMTPSKVQYFLAQDWLAKVWMTIFPVLGAGVAVYASEIASSATTHLSSFFWLICLLILGAAIGWFGGILTGSVVLGPFYMAVARWNGAPFHPGEQVQILTGPYRDRILTVYAAYRDPDKVRVELGEEAKKKWTDVFPATEVCRVSQRVLN